MAEEKREAAGPKDVSKDPKNTRGPKKLIP